MLDELKIRKKKENKVTLVYLAKDKNGTYFLNVSRSEQFMKDEKEKINQEEKIPTIIKINLD